jgi:hypothetical protein
METSSERVEDVHRLLEPNGVHGPKRVSLVRLDDLQDARTEPLPRLRRRRYPPELRDAERVTHVLLDRRRKRQEVALGRPNPMQRLFAGGQDTAHFTIIPVLGCSIKCVRAAHGSDRDMAAFRDPVFSRILGPTPHAGPFDGDNGS